MTAGLDRTKVQFVYPIRVRNYEVDWQGIDHNTSFVMESIVERADTGERLVDNVAFHARLDPDSNVSIRVPDDFRALVHAFEGSRCIMGPSNESELGQGG